MRYLCSSAFIGGFLFAAPGHAQDPQAFLRTWCVSCHQGKSSAGGRNLTKVEAGDVAVWQRVLARVRDQQMPPVGMKAPSSAAREAFVASVEASLHATACASGPQPGHAWVRRLNRSEYAATVRDLLDIHINAAAGLPADGAGGEGFDNAAETLTISPIHAEKYLEAARQALGYAFTDTKSRTRFLLAGPGAQLTAEAAARRNLELFLARAFRRPVKAGEVDRYLALFAEVQRRGNGFEDALSFTMAAVMVSPNFLFRIAEPNLMRERRLIPDVEMASRLSYFLWGSMPDDQLFALAREGKLQQPEALEKEVARMLADVKSREFAENFVEQWLGTRELGRDIKPDATLFPMYYDAELQSAIRYEPVLFFQEVLQKNHSLLDLLDSKYTILTNKLERHYGLKLPKEAKVGQQPIRVDLPEGSHRGGVLSMAAVLAVSSYPNRTSPVLRGKFILDAILGTPPPPPPPNVPQLKESSAAVPTTLRERLTEHRKNPVCAACHNRIDPLGFALENYDVLGRWRTTDGGKPIDASGQLPAGDPFEGADGLKRVLLERKDLFIRNLTAKMLGYALGRGLTLTDQCTVDAIVAELARQNYSAQTLVREIVMSAPFRYQEAAR